ncbi:hypothetical protein SAMN02910265_01234 [Ruminococcus flavefaciens]|uniref:Uncharacterized protein n=1 Tax=Ruminococcus flavefaciens TaxID=1265 RepID=A0A1H6ISR0_RUMFL|nr:hypothetical protein SAMN02910265_01234 [Ruminococcus flavefaciens]
MNIADDTESKGVYSLNTAVTAAIAIAKAVAISERRLNTLRSMSSNGLVGVSVGAKIVIIIAPVPENSAET